MNPLKSLNEYSQKDKVMTDGRRNRILTINSGSSTIKFSLHHLAPRGKAYRGHNPHASDVKAGCLF